MPDQLIIIPLRDVPMITPGDDLTDIVADGLLANDLALDDGDILVLAQKIVSKSEGRIVDLRTVTPGPEAYRLSEVVEKDPRLVELILSESLSVIRQVRGVLITEHKRGWIMANAGIDASNVRSVRGEENVLLLPENPDLTCRMLRQHLLDRLGKRFGVIISDSFGRPWRLGTTGVALGAAGVPSLWDRRGDRDLFGRELKVSQQAVADELAAAASLVQGQGAESRPIAVIQGLNFGPAATPTARPASDLIRDASEDLFR